MTIKSYSDEAIRGRGSIWFSSSKGFYMNLTGFIVHQGHNVSLHINLKQGYNSPGPLLAKYCPLWTSPQGFKTRLIGKGFHTLIKGVSCSSPTNVEYHPGKLKKEWKWPTHMQNFLQNARGNKQRRPNETTSSNLAKHWSVSLYYTA